MSIIKVCPPIFTGERNSASPSSGVAWVPPAWLEVARLVALMTAVFMVSGTAHPYLRYALAISATPLRVRTFPVCSRSILNDRFSSAAGAAEASRMVRARTSKELK